jgi:hypothetical protein
LLFAVYLTEASKLPTFADGSSQALQAWDMLHGNPLLHGWVLSDVAFYTTEIPQYMLIESVRGLNPDVVHIAAAMTYALVVVLAAILAKGKAAGREALVRVIITVGIMVAPPMGQILVSRGYSTAWVLLSAPDHIGTQVPLLLMWLMIDRKWPRWWLPTAMTILLALVEIADSTAIYEGALPIVLLCLMRWYQRGGPLAENLHDVAMATGALISIGLSFTALNVIRALGGFIVNPASPKFTTIIGLNTNFWLKVNSILVLFGANFFGTTPATAVIPISHLIAVALVAWGVVRAARVVFTTEDVGMQVVTASFLALLVAFIFGFRTGAREASGLLPLGAVLAGRMLATRVFEVKLVPILAAALALFGISMGVTLSRPAWPNSPRSLASWLAAHHLTYGLSTTWFASNGITLYTQDHVKVRDVKITAYGRLRRTRWNTQAGWYDPNSHNARFVVLNPCVSAIPRRLLTKDGQPSVIYHVDGFTVIVWKDTNLLLARPKPPAVPGQAQVRFPLGKTGPVAHKLMCG